MYPDSPSVSMNTALLGAEGGDGSDGVDLVREVNRSGSPAGGSSLKKSASKENFSGKKPSSDVETGLLSSDEIPFSFSHGLSSSEAQRLLEKYGPNTLPETIVPKWYIFLQQLWQPMPIMIWIAAIVEASLRNYEDMGVLLFIQFFNATLGYKEITSAGDAVAALKKTLQARAEVYRDGRWTTIPAADVVPGDMVKLASGSAIPADCRVNEGTIDVDQSAMTGESLPVTMFRGDKCIMGSTVARGETEGTVEFTGAETVYGKTAKMLAQTSESSNLQKLLISIVIILVVMCIVLCSTVLIYLSYVTSFTEAISYAVVLMVASIPMAIEIVTTTTLALGSKELAKRGAIVTRLAAIEDMAGMAILCSDKTGTLTKNIMELQTETPVYAQGMTQYLLLRYAAMAAKWKEDARDALDRLTLGCVDMASMSSVEQIEYVPFDPVVKRTEGTVIENGQRFKTTKGAPHVILELCMSATVGANSSGSEVHARVELDVRLLGERGIRSLAVAKTNSDGKWEMLGLLTFLDPPREDTAQTIREAIQFGVAVKMITGDHLLIAKEMAKRLQLGEFILSAEGLPMLGEDKKKPENMSKTHGDLCLCADGFAQVFPEHKYLIVECLRELGYKVGMTGDGVNDAPALKRADVGVAVHGSTDAARAAADIVLTEPGLSTIVHGIFLSRQIFKRISNFLTYRIAATLQLLVFFFISVFAYRPVEFMPDNWQTLEGFPDTQEWSPYFHMPVIMLILITLLNDFSLIAIGYDYVQPQDTPCVWNKRALFFISSVLAAVALVSSLILLEFSLNSWNPHSFYASIGLGGLSYGQVTTSIYLKVSVSDFLTLFSARTGGDWFWTQRPAPMLLGAACFALAVSTILACSWPAGKIDEVYALGLGYREPKALPVFIWFYCIFWWFVQDAAKVFFHRLMRKYNLFGVNNSGVLVLPSSALEYKRNIIAKQLLSGATAHKH